MFLYRLKKKGLVLACMIVGIVSGCTKQSSVEIKIDRFDQALFSVPVSDVASEVPQLEEHYGELFDLYNHQVIAIGGADDPQYALRLTDFLTDSHMYEAFRKVSALYPDVNDIEQGLSKAFTNYHHYFPERLIPSVYTLISGYNQSIIITDTILGISLDRYLGVDEEIYQSLGLAHYQRALMERKHIVPDCIKAWGYTEFPEAPENVLGNILYEGKIIYFQKKMLPQAPDSLLFGYTPAQVHWCINNTSQMWTFLVEKKLLYVTDYLTLSKLVGPAPFTSLFTRESPGRAAVWLGYQIIESYMKHNRITLEDLMLLQDYQELLAKAKFKP